MDEIDFDEEPNEEMDEEMNLWSENPIKNAKSWAHAFGASKVEGDRDAIWLVLESAVRHMMDLRNELQAKDLQISVLRTVLDKESDKTGIIGAGEKLKEAMKGMAVMMEAEKKCPTETEIKGWGKPSEMSSHVSDTDMGSKEKIPVVTREESERIGSEMGVTKVLEERDHE